MLSHEQHFSMCLSQEHGALRIGIKSVQAADVFAEGAHGLTNRFKGHVDQHGFWILLPADEVGNVGGDKSDRDENDYSENE